MKNKRIEERIQHSLNAELSGWRTTSYQRDKFYENATGGYKVKRKISVVAILVAAWQWCYSLRRKSWSRWQCPRHKAMSKKTIPMRIYKTCSKL